MSTEPTTTPAEKVKPKKKYNLIEKKISASIERWLKKQEGCWYLKQGSRQPSSFNTQRPGTPDLCVVYHGRTTWMEIKKPGGYLSPKQKECIARMIGAGAEVFVVRSLDDVKKILQGE